MEHMKADHMKDEQEVNMARRETLLMLGAAMIALPAAAQTSGGAGAAGGMPACVVTPEQTEGPFFIDERLNRANLRVDPADGSFIAGVPLTLTLHAMSVGSTGCAPLAGAIVDVWHCNAQGKYSGVSDGKTDSRESNFLRGYQVTDTNGTVRFTTIYPGWYPGRTVHIHFKVSAPAGGDRMHEFTSQLYFDDAVTERVLAHQAYKDSARRRVRNAEDSLFRHGGRELMLTLKEQPQGYAAAFDIGIRTA